MKWTGLFVTLGAMGACATSADKGESTRVLGQQASTTCAHDVLCTGGPLQGGSNGSGCTTSSGADGWCVQEVCNDYPTCCTTAWTNTCVQDMANYNEAGGYQYNDCPSPTSNPAPVCAGSDAGSGSCGECTTHSGALSSSCDSCTAAVCSHDSYCCKTAWDSQCVSEVTTYCGASTCSDGGLVDSGADAAQDSSVDAAKDSSVDAVVDSASDSSADGPVDSPSDSGVVPPTLPSPTLSAISLPSLTFGILGDVRPANANDTASFPDSILSAIFAGLQSQGLALTVDVGDHCFQSSTSSGSYCHDQFVNHFMADRNANYSGKLLPTLGNHEGCGSNAATSANCTSWSSGLIHDFLVDIVQPSTGQSAYPYYSVVAYGSWGTAKFVHIAANAWTSAQNTWLTSTLNVATTYTFVVRHEPSNANTAPGVTPSESLLSSHYSGGTLTLSLTGHTHLVQLPGSTKPYGDSYGATQAYEIIIGNAGAPLDAGPYYGYAVVTRRASDGAVVVQSYESVSSDGVTLLNNAADTSYRFAVNPNGSSNSNTSLP